MVQSFHQCASLPTCSLHKCTSSFTHSSHQHASFTNAFPSLAHSPHWCAFSTNTCSLHPHMLSSSKHVPLTYTHSHALFTNTQSGLSCVPLTHALSSPTLPSRTRSLHLCTLLIHAFSSSTCSPRPISIRGCNNICDKMICTFVTCTLICKTNLTLVYRKS
jgi:hypothetical protein